jgi:hypothetical protein
MILKSLDFCFWLQGYFEIHESGLAERCSERMTGTMLNAEQVNVIRKHLDLAFKHEIDQQIDTANQAENIKKGNGRWLAKNRKNSLKE